MNEIKAKIAMPTPGNPTQSKLLPDYDPKARETPVQQNADAIAQQVVDMLNLGPAGSAIQQVAGAVNNLNQSVQMINTKLDGATISAECNEDGTITVTLNWGT